MNSYTIETVVRGYHVYWDIWEAAVGQILPCQRERGNVHDPYAVAVVNRLAMFHWPYPQFTSFWAAAILEEGTTVDRWLSGFGRELEIATSTGTSRSITAPWSTQRYIMPHPQLCHAPLHMPRPQNFAEKTFAVGLKPTKFAKFFSLESFPLYGSTNYVTLILIPVYYSDTLEVAELILTMLYFYAILLYDYEVVTLLKRLQYHLHYCSLCSSHRKQPSRVEQERGLPRTEDKKPGTRLI